MTTYRESSAYARWVYVVLTIFVVGGVVILVAGAVADGARSIALIATGALWLVAGSVGWAHRRRMALTVELDGDQLTFDLRERALVVPVRAISEIRRPGYDVNRLDCLLVSTATDGTIRVSPRLDRLADMVAELKIRNPAIRITRVRT